jgi:hypothetical protein
MLDPSMSDEERKLHIAQRNTCRHTKIKTYRYAILKEIDQNHPRNIETNI